jgi:hypothetical protein
VPLPARPQQPAGGLPVRSHYIHKEHVTKEQFSPNAAFSYIERFSDNSIGGIMWISLAHTTLVTDTKMINATKTDSGRLVRRPIREYMCVVNQ